jgi:hypothetical protein
MSTHPLFDKVFLGCPSPVSQPLTGEQLRDSGIQQAVDHLERVKAEYIDSCLYEIQQLSKGTTLTSEDLRELAGDPPIGCENAVAGILKRAQSRGLITNTGEERPTKRSSVHAKRLCIWRRI